MYFLFNFIMGGLLRSHRRVPQPVERYLHLKECEFCHEGRQGDEIGSLEPFFSGEAEQSLQLITI